jgi:predicted nucleotidyltransferase
VDCESIVAHLLLNQSELEAQGIVAVSLFGSVARAESIATSDIDLAVRLTPGPRGFPHLKRMDDLKLYLSAILGCAVDVVEEPCPSVRIQREIERDRIVVF